MSLDLLLINPRSRDLIYQDLGAGLTALEPPLWFRLIAGYALDRGYSVAGLDSEAENQTATAIVVCAGTCLRTAGEETQ